MSLPPPPAATEDKPGPDLVAARSGSIVAPLDHLGVLRFSGEDAREFLQGQLSCDVTAMGPKSATYGAYCTPKGRMLASFLLWREETDFLMALSRDIAPAIQRQLSKFVLRSRVKVFDVSDATALTGAAGPQAERALGAVLPEAPKQANEVSRQPGPATAIRLADGRFVLATSSPGVAALRQKLAGLLESADARAWRWLDIRNGVPRISAATQDELVPQMANLEILGGVSFDKGCYTGQEVVARTQHLGKLKRRMFLANVPAHAEAGDKLYSEDLGDQAGGMVVNAEVSPDGGWDLLAVVQTASREASTVHLKSLDGPALRFLPLPYTLA
ncbi:MAG: folate-binding protein YgfZ [Burkholderiales bacterium]